MARQLLGIGSGFNVHSTIRWFENCTLAIWIGFIEVFCLDFTFQYNWWYKTKKLIKISFNSVIDNSTLKRRPRLDPWPALN